MPKENNPTAAQFSKPILDAHITLRVERTLKDKIQRACLTHNVSASDIMRHALERYFTQE